ncbi:MAG: hypothetical protein ACYC21_11675, partial [Eubacteriales bacterium]
MSKTKSFAKVIRLIVLFLVYGLKITIAVISRLLNQLFKGIGKRLRFSITFKTTSIYTFVFSMILLILSIIMVSSFGLFLLNESKSSLERSARVTRDFVSESSGIPAAKIKKYADIEGITITLLNKQREITYTTGGNNNIASNDVISNTSRIFITADEYMHLTVPTQLNDNVYYILLSKSLSVGKEYLLILLFASTVSFILAVIL